MVYVTLLTFASSIIALQAFGIHVVLLSSFVILGRVFRSEDARANASGRHCSQRIRGSCFTFHDFASESCLHFCLQFCLQFWDLQESEECPAPARPTKPKAKAKAKQSPAKRPAASAYETPKKRPATRETEDEFSDATTLELGEEIPKKKKTEKKGEQKAKSKTEKKEQDKKGLKSESKAKGKKQESTSKSKSEKQESTSKSESDALQQQLLQMMQQHAEYLTSIFTRNQIFGV